MSALEPVQKRILVIRIRKANATVLIPTFLQGVTPPCPLLLICLPLFSCHLILQSNILGFILFYVLLHFVINLATQGWAVVSFHLGCYRYVGLLNGRLLVLQLPHLDTPSRVEIKA